MFPPFISTVPLFINWVLALFPSPWEESLEPIAKPFPTAELTVLPVLTVTTSLDNPTLLKSSDALPTLIFASISNVELI